MSILFVLFGVCVALVSGQTTNVEQCQRNEGDIPINTFIHGCIDPPCILPQLEDCVIDVIFRAPRVIRSMRTLATAYMNLGAITLPIPYDLGEHAVTCNFLTNTYCPVLTGEVVSYTLRMFVEPFFPQGTSTIIEFRIVDDHDVPFVCIRLGITIAPPREPTSQASRLKIEHVYNATALDGASIQIKNILN